MRLGRIAEVGLCHMESRVFEGYNPKEPKIMNNLWLSLGVGVGVGIFTKQKCQELGIRQKSPPWAAQRFRGEAYRRGTIVAQLNSAGLGAQLLSASAEVPNVLPAVLLVSLRIRF